MPHVWLYKTRVAPGAFAIGPTWEERTYYRGGISQDLLTRIKKVLAVADKPKTK
jgi:hypothetical protein